MKKQLLKTIKHLIKEGHDLKEQPVLFEWRYEEYPDLQLKLLIQEVDINLPDKEETIH